MSQKNQGQLSEMQASMYKEQQKVSHLQMELSAKEAEVEQIMQKVSLQSSETTSVNSGSLDAEDCKEDSFPGGECYREVIVLAW